ncbi:unnamed protein product, partial [Rotaria sp. Silwood1]
MRDINISTKTNENDLNEKNISIDEPLLRDNPSRYVLFPIKYHNIWKFYKRALASIWACEEVDLANDMNDWLR